MKFKTSTRIYEAEPPKPAVLGYERTTTITFEGLNDDALTLLWHMLNVSASDMADKVRGARLFAPRVAAQFLSPDAKGEDWIKQMWSVVDEAVDHNSRSRTPQ